MFSLLFVRRLIFATGILSFSCAAGKIVAVETNAELNERVLRNAAAQIPKLRIAQGATIVVLPSQGLHAGGGFPEQSIENRIASGLLTQGFRPVERSKAMVRVLGLNQNGYQAGFYVDLTKEDEHGYDAGLVEGTSEKKPISLAGEEHGYLKRVPGEGGPLQIDPNVLRILAGPGTTKAFHLEQPDYFLVYDVLHLGVRYVEAERLLGERQIQRRARVNLFLRLVDARTAQIVEVFELDREESDTVPIQALAYAEKNVYRYFPVGQAEKAMQGISSHREALPPSQPVVKDSPRPEHQLFLSLGALVNDQAQIFVAPRFEYSLTSILGIASGLGFSTSSRAFEFSRIVGTTRIWQLEPEFGIKLTLPLLSQIQPYAKLGGGIKFIIADEDSTQLPSLGVGVGLESFFGQDLAFKVGGALHYSKDDTLRVGELPHEFIPLKGTQLELSASIGWRL